MALGFALGAAAKPKRTAIREPAAAINLAIKAGGAQADLAVGTTAQRTATAIHKPANAAATGPRGQRHRGLPDAGPTKVRCEFLHRTAAHRSTACRAFQAATGKAG
jgi:hypothetical protein